MQGGFAASDLLIHSSLLEINPGYVSSARGGDVNHLVGWNKHIGPESVSSCKFLRRVLIYSRDI